MRFSMTTYVQEMQALFHKYQKEVDPDPTNLSAVYDWVTRNGLWKPRPADISKRFAAEMADALRQEYRKDKAGRTYRANHAVRATQEGKQTSFWADIDTAPRSHMEKAFQQRRKHIVGECYQLSLDVDHYNDIKADDPPIQIVFDFSDDVEERKVAAGLDEAA